MNCINNERIKKCIKNKIMKNELLKNELIKKELIRTCSTISTSHLPPSHLRLCCAASVQPIRGGRRGPSACDWPAGWCPSWCTGTGHSCTDRAPSSPHPPPGKMRF